MTALARKSAGWPVRVTVRGVEFDLAGTFVRGSRGDREQPDEPDAYEIDFVCVAGTGDDLMEFVTDRFLDECASKAVEQLGGRDDDGRDY